MRRERLPGVAPACNVTEPREGRPPASAANAQPGDFRNHCAGRGTAVRACTRPTSVGEDPVFVNISCSVHPTVAAAVAVYDAVAAWDERHPSALSRRARLAALMAVAEARAWA